MVFKVRVGFPLTIKWRGTGTSLSKTNYPSNFKLYFQLRKLYSKQLSVDRSKPQLSSNPVLFHSRSVTSFFGFSSTPIKSLIKVCAMHR